MAYRDYSTAHGHIVDATGQGDFTTLGAAMTAAVAGDTIFLRPGSYGAGIGITPGVNICSFGCEGMEGSPPNVEITGTLTLNGAGSVSIYGVNFNVSANALVVGGSFATFLNVENCYFTIDIATAISFTNSNTSSQINLRNCSGNTGSSSVAVWACSGAGALNLYDCDFTNFGSSTATNTSIAGTVSYYRGSIGTQMQFTATCQALLLGVVADTSAVNVPAIIAGSAGTTCFNCLINSGTADAVQVSAAAVMSQCFIGATGANAITGAGTLFYSDLTFGGTNTITVSTATPQNWQPYSTAGNSSTAVRGTAGFDSTFFTDVNGFVSLISAPNPPITGTATTIGATTATTINVTLPTGAGNAGTYLFETNTVGYDAASPSGGTLNEIVGIIYDGTTATIMPTPGSDLSSIPPFVQPSIAEYYTTTSGNVVSITVQGTAGLTVNWFSSLTFIKVT